MSGRTVGVLSPPADTALAPSPAVYYIGRSGEVKRDKAQGGSINSVTPLDGLPP
jgi:hypothetical protein